MGLKQMIFEIYVTILTFDTDIFNALSNSDDFNIEPETWDLTPEKLNSDLYLRHIFFKILIKLRVFLRLGIIFIH